MANRILVVEDDTAISELICMNLEVTGYEVVPVLDGNEVEGTLEKEENFDLALLDIMLPGKDGFELLGVMKEYGIPVIYITAKADVNSKIKGLRSGAEDYIVKPFEVLELLVRVEKVLERTGKQKEIIQVKDLEIHLSEHKVTRNGQTVSLKPMEYDLLVLLAKNKNVAFTREQMLNEVWGSNYLGETRTIDVHIGQLRRKLDLSDVIKTIPDIDWRSSMKLWQKISLLTAAILLISMVVYGGITVYETSNYNIRQTSSAASRQVRATAYALGQSLENAATEEMSDTARKAYLQFLLRRYSSRDYMLLQDWQLAANTTNFELTGNRLEQFDSYEPVAAFQQKNGRHLMIVGQKIPLSDSKNTSYQLLLVRDISEIYNNVLTQIGMFLVILGAIVAVAINAVFWMIRRMLKPLRDLRETAGAISQGQLDRRVRVRSNDEVGALSVSFNQMADQIECQMEELAQVSERRKQLLGSLAHELKTPMTSIIGYSDTLLHVRINEEQQKKALTHINNECRRLERLSGKMMNLLELYNNETIHMEKHPVSQLIGKVAELEKYHLKEQGITLETRSDDTVLLMDMDLMESLLVNLIDNAMKASKEGDTIYVEAAGTCILVEDHGRGIPAEEIPKITEAFYMVDKSRSKKAGGIGLGLALCTQIVNLHGAKMEIKSKPGVGTQIRVIFSEEQ